MIKNLRKQTLGLDKFTKQHKAHAIYYSNVPFSYIWSPHLAPKPSDWPDWCRVVGFSTVELAKHETYTPPAGMAAFLAAGDPPIYIGFGSLVVDNPEALTNSFMKAIEEAHERFGLRFIMQTGWGGLGSGLNTLPPHVLRIEAAPHDWLFEQCCAVVHHGGAGTTATGLRAGKPTFIVPFFGDQHFWGAAITNVGAGLCVPVDELSTAKIAAGFEKLCAAETVSAARTMQLRLQGEDGAAAAAQHIMQTIILDKAPTSFRFK